jgi:hypothetical protein
LEKVLTYTLVFILSLLCFNINIVQQVVAAELGDEPNISLKVENQPLGEVLKKIASDTGFKIKLNKQWSIYPVNASIEDMPLHQGLKLILRGLNHAIIYESDKSIKIVVYEEVDSRQTDSYPIQPSSSQIQDNQSETTPSPKSSPEEADDLKGADENSEETDTSENTVDKSTENEDSSDSGKDEGSEENGTEESKKLDQDSSGQSENTNEQNEQGNAAEDTPSESSQE